MKYISEPRPRILRRIQYDAEKGYRIIGAYRLTLCIGTVFWITLLLLLAATTMVTSVLTIPVLVYWLLRYIVFCQWWKKMHFSKIYVIGMPILAAILAVVFRCLFVFLIQKGV